MQDPGQNRDSGPFLPPLPHTPPIRATMTSTDVPGQNRDLSAFPRPTPFGFLTLGTATSSQKVKTAIRALSSHHPLIPLKFAVL